MICKRCRDEILITSEIIFHRSKLPLVKIFRALWWMAAQKNGVSALGFNEFWNLVVIQQPEHSFINFGKMKTTYPRLTQSDLRLCAYLRMKLSSKEIVPLLVISFRGVENHRYRLRKKMNLEHDENLVHIINGT